MSYRSSRGGRAAKRAAQKQLELDRLVHSKSRAWLSANPPRVPSAFELGEWERGSTLDGTYNVDFFGFEERRDRNMKKYWAPQGSVVRVPVMDRRLARMFASNPIQAQPDVVHYLEMRPVRMGLSWNQTRVRWWNWEPINAQVFGDAEADIYSAAGKMLAYLERIRTVLQWFPLDSSAVFSGALTLREFLVWYGELVSAMEEWRGKVRVRYVIPGKTPGDPPEERTR